MKKSEMKAIKECRENIIGFLHPNEMQTINAILGIDVDKLDFYTVCDLTIKNYADKKITNKKASEVFDILSQANKQFKIERYRYDKSTKTIYEFDEEHDAYLFLENSGHGRYVHLVTVNGMYI
ncbi:hypothetical protein LU293_04115 [Moraxella nasovis]|uniref:hypothetical protein n=1 Tax=Moraxella nasovis TaxID=2904121 RepID=UPI001F613DEE|nr:hypothetical protein [Moraxella nasovis]UNU74087.1 hypothetical protein LU293_04115 [Moraxella nasovis]